jgi:hypothetical protein
MDQEVMELDLAVLTQLSQQRPVPLELCKSMMIRVQIVTGKVQ